MAELTKRMGENARNSVGLLVSILIRYPEPATLSLDPSSSTITFKFLVTEVISRRRFWNLRRKVFESLKTFHHLNKVPMVSLRVEQVGFDGLTVIEVTRDVASLTQQEITLVIELMKEELGNSLVIDNTARIPFEEEMTIQEELIEQMLDDIREVNTTANLIAVREEGRVLVFNK